MCLYFSIVWMSELDEQLRSTNEGLGMSYKMIDMKATFQNQLVNGISLINHRLQQSTLFVLSLKESETRSCSIMKLKQWKIDLFVDWQNLYKNFDSQAQLSVSGIQSRIWKFPSCSSERVISEFQCHLVQPFSCIGHILQLSFI